MKEAPWKRVTVRSKRRRLSSTKGLQNHFQIFEEVSDRQHAEEDMQETLPEDVKEAEAHPSKLTEHTVPTKRRREGSLLGGAETEIGWEDPWICQVCCFLEGGLGM